MYFPPDKTISYGLFGTVNYNTRLLHIYEKLSRQCAYMYSIFREILGHGGETDYPLSHKA